MSLLLPFSVSYEISLVKLLVGEREISCLVPGCKHKNKKKKEINKHVEREDCMEE